MEIKTRQSITLLGATLICELISFLLMLGIALTFNHLYWFEYWPFWISTFVFILTSGLIAYGWALKSSKWLASPLKLHKLIFLTLCPMLFIAALACIVFRGGENEYIGKWRNVDVPNHMLEISRYGDAFLVFGGIPYLEGRGKIAEFSFKATYLPYSHGDLFNLSNGVLIASNYELGKIEIIYGSSMFREEATEMVLIAKDGDHIYKRVCNWEPRSLFFCIKNKIKYSI